MVPKGWKLTSLSEVCGGNLQTGPFGSQLHANEYVSSGVPVLMPKDLINCRANLTGAAKITVEKADALKKHLLQSGDLLFSRRGDVSRFALIDKKSEGALCGTGCLRARPSNNHSSKFLAYFLQKDSVKKWLEQNAVGQTMLNINTEILGELPLISASSKAEEEKIAQILSTWDKAITITERLLANSQQQKKALMQQLLTGKKRLLDENGVRFTGEWKQNSLSRIVDVYHEKSTSNNQFPIVTSSRRGLFLQEDYFKKQVASDNNTGYKIVPKGYVTFRSMSDDGIFVFNRQTILENALISPAYGVFVFSSIDGDFGMYLINSHLMTREIKKLTQGGTRIALKTSIFTEIFLKIPSIKEQQKIASALMLNDQEIERSQQKIELLKQEKKALMQQLLTGKRRVKTDNKDVV